MRGSPLAKTMRPALGNAGRRDPVGDGVGWS